MINGHEMRPYAVIIKVLTWRSDRCLLDLPFWFLMASGERAMASECLISFEVMAFFTGYHHQHTSIITPRHRFITCTRRKYVSDVWTDWRCSCAKDDCGECTYKEDVANKVISVRRVVVPHLQCHLSSD